MPTLDKIYSVICIISIFCFTAESAIAITYEENIKQYEDQFKSNCESSGRVYEKSENGSTCGAPKVSLKPQPPANGRCQNYAQKAIQQYQVATSPRAESWGCNANTNPRWSPNYQAHYNWCLKAPVEWLHSEEKARTDYLNECNRLHRID